MDVGGDAFDVIGLPGGRCCVYLADVSGHGVAPAMISSMLKASATELILSFYKEGPACICNELHMRICRTLNNPSYYATMFMAIYEPANNRWVCMNCGHPDPVLGRDGRPVAFPKGGGGIPLGMQLGPPRPYEEADQTLLDDCAGLQILFYTDGLSEAVHQETGEECGEENLRDLFVQVVSDPEIVRTPGALLNRMEETYSVGSDDCTAIVIRMTNPSCVRLDTMVPVDMQSVSDVCEKMEQLVLERGDEDIAARIRLVAMEHAMNVVEHGGLDSENIMWVQLRFDGRCARLIFSDSGREWDYEAAAARECDIEDYSDGGRGLAIANVAADYAERYRRDFKNVVCYHFRRKAD
jgi:anti-sigma regulatory factor (Ser/Thr protein kinase)